MAIPVNIDDLINRRVVESTRIEFKEDLNPNSVVHSICALCEHNTEQEIEHILKHVPEVVAYFLDLQIKVCSCLRSNSDRRNKRQIRTLRQPA